MHRCFLKSLATALTLLTCAAWLPTQAQPSSVATPRTFPAQALRGELIIGNMPEVRLNGQAMRTTPGFRLYGHDGRLLMAHNFAGQSLQVNYVIEPSTQWLHQAWVLTPQEAARP